MDGAAGRSWGGDARTSSWPGGWGGDPSPRAAGRAGSSAPPRVSDTASRGWRRPRQGNDPAAMRPAAHFPIDASLTAADTLAGAGAGPLLTIKALPGSNARSKVELVRFFRQLWRERARDESSTHQAPDHTGPVHGGSGRCLVVLSS